MSVEGRKRFLGIEDSIKPLPAPGTEADGTIYRLPIPGPYFSGGMTFEVDWSTDDSDVAPVGDIEKTFWKS